jgi:hypothetical protein
MTSFVCELMPFFLSSPRPPRYFAPDLQERLVNVHLAKIFCCPRPTIMLWRRRQPYTDCCHGNCPATDPSSSAFPALFPRGFRVSPKSANSTFRNPLQPEAWRPPPASLPPIACLWLKSVCTVRGFFLLDSLVLDANQSARSPRPLPAPLSHCMHRLDGDIDTRHCMPIQPYYMYRVCIEKL